MKQRDHDLNAIITEEKLKQNDTWKFIENELRDGEIKTTETNIDKFIPSISHFGGGGEAQKKKAYSQTKNFLWKVF